MWGWAKSDWINSYISLLEPYFDIKLYDSGALANIDYSYAIEKQIHTQFMDGGIDLAVKSIINAETEKIDVLAFSIGGTIAWKAGMNGLEIGNLFLVSSTRIRYEIQRPHCEIRLYFGEYDNFKPDDTWFSAMKLNYVDIKLGQHDIYENEEIAHRICSDMLDLCLNHSGIQNQP